MVWVIVVLLVIFGVLALGVIVVAAEKWLFNHHLIKRNIYIYKSKSNWMGTDPNKRS